MDSTPEVTAGLTPRTALTQRGRTEVAPREQGEFQQVDGAVCPEAHSWKCSTHLILLIAAE